MKTFKIKRERKFVPPKMDYGGVYYNELKAYVPFTDEEGDPYYRLYTYDMNIRCWSGQGDVSCEYFEKHIKPDTYKR